MKLNELFVDDRAVSPVVGVALLIAITVILAAVIGGVVLGLGTGGVDTPQAQLQLDHDGENDANITHNGGEPLDADEIVIEIYGAIDYQLDGDLSAGGSVLMVEDDDSGSAPVDEGDEVVILWDDPNSDSTTVLDEFDV